MNIIETIVTLSKYLKKVFIKSTRFSKLVNLVRINSYFFVNSTFFKYQINQVQSIRLIPL